MGEQPVRIRSIMNLYPWWRPECDHQIPNIDYSRFDDPTYDRNAPRYIQVLCVYGGCVEWLCLKCRAFKMGMGPAYCPCDSNLIPAANMRKRPVAVKPSDHRARRNARYGRRVG